MSGKDLIDSVKTSSQICRILGGTPPEGFNYELFLDEHNQKISKSKGNGLTLEDWSRHGTPESLVYYLSGSPRSAKKLAFEVIPAGRRQPAAARRLSPPAAGGQPAPGQPPRQPGVERPRRGPARQGLAGVVRPADQPGLGGQRF